MALHRQFGGQLHSSILLNVIIPEELQIPLLDVVLGWCGRRTRRVVLSFNQIKLKKSKLTTSVESENPVPAREMSAYGAIVRPSPSDTPLPSTIWPLASANSNAHGYLTIHHLTLSTARMLPGLIEHLNIAFAKEVEDGFTYPQEGEIGKETFEGYFFAADVLVGIIGATGRPIVEGTELDLDIDGAQAGRTWDDCVAGFYYVSPESSRNLADSLKQDQVKPNYPGRSSHVSVHRFYPSWYLLIDPPTHHADLQRRIRCSAQTPRRGVWLSLVEILRALCSEARISSQRFQPSLC